MVASLTGAVIALMGVGSLVTPAAATPARATLAACTNNVSFGLLDANTSGCLNEVAPGRWETTDTVSLNGISLIPVSGTKVVLVAPTAASPGGQLSVDTSITVAGVTFEK